MENLEQLNWDKFLFLSKIDALKKQELFEKTYDLENCKNYHLDLENNKMTFEKNENYQLNAKIQVSGVITKNTGLWYWSSDIKSFPSESKKLTTLIKKIGQQYNFPALSNSCWLATEDDGVEMLAVSMKLLKGIGFYIIKTNKVSYFITILTIDEKKKMTKKYKNKI